MNKPKVPNQLHRDLLGVNGLNPFKGHNSSSREQMFSSHIGQTLVVKGGTERRIQTGMEREYAKYTFSVKMPVDGEIIRVIERYRNKIGMDTIAFNPQTLIIYEDVNTKQIGMVNIPNYCSMHQYFGFEYKARPALSEVRAGAFIAKDTILLDSPSVTDDGGYKYGVECNVAYMTHPAVSEDGILISSDVLPRFGFKTYESRTVEWGSKRFPLNLYGDIDNFKPFPDIGDRIRPDGILMALRNYDKELAPVEQGINDLMEPDFTFDKLTYAAGEGGRIVDIRIQHDNANSQNVATAGMEVQPEKYDHARRQFYQDIVTEYQRLKRERGEGLQLTEEFHRMVVEALAVVDNDPQRIIKLYRQAPLDDWRIEFIIEYDITPTIGFKLTDCHGGKGVACKIGRPEDMPVDEAGNRADIVMDPNSTVSRMNLGRLYEQYYNACSRDIAIKIRKDLACVPNEKGLEAKLAAMDAGGSDAIERAWNYLMGFYAIVSPKMYVWMTGGEYKKPRTDHLASVIRKGIYLYMPPDNEPESKAILMELEKHYRPTYGPVTYVGNSGRKVTTKNPVRIGSVYIILLEKIGDDWTAVSSGKLQHFGVLSQVTNNDKNSQPTRNQAIRALGESEVRIYVSYAGGHVTADILDRNNNPATHKQILYNILGANKPTDIDLAVDRKKIPLGGAKPLQLVKHIAECGGWKFIHSYHTPTAPTPQLAK